MKVKDYKKKYGKKFIQTACSKQIEMKPKNIMGIGICPRCHCIAFDEKKEFPAWRNTAYCWGCGQKLKIIR